MADTKRGSAPQDEFDDFFDGPESSVTNPDEVPDETTEQRLAWLKPQMLRKDTGTLELIGLGEGTEFSDVTIEVKIPGHPTLFRIGLKLFSPEYKSLKKRFGKKKADWHGTLKYKLMPHKGNPKGFIAVR